MCDGHQASQPERPLRHRHVFGRHPWRRRTFHNRYVPAGRIQFHPNAFNYLIDPRYLGCLPVLNASSGVVVAEGTVPALPGWPWVSMQRQKNSRLPRPVGPRRAYRRRLIPSSDPGGVDPDLSGTADSKRSPTDTLSGGRAAVSPHASPGIASADSPGGVTDALPNLGSVPSSAPLLNPTPPSPPPVDP
jgi:hypothetical protein